MIKSGQYVNGSVAEKISYDVYEENKVLKTKKKQKSYLAVKCKAVFCLVSVFAVGSLVIFRYATLTQLNYDLAKQTKAYNNLINENSYLSVQIDQSMDIQKIRNIAENKLGMQKPDKSQINYVSIAKNNYTKVASEYSNEKTGNSLVNWFQNILGLIK